MPAPPKTSEADIVAAARRIVADRGADALALAGVAAAVGIRAPSLYKRFADRAALLDAVRESVLRDLAVMLGDSGRARDPAKRLIAMGRAYRRFARDNPFLYRLILVSGSEPSPAARGAIMPVLAALTELVGADLALPAARSLTAFLHGFVSMEINRSFQLGGSLDEAFEFGLDAILRGLGPPRGRRRSR